MIIVIFENFQRFLRHAFVVSVDVHAMAKFDSPAVVYMYSEFCVSLYFVVLVH